MSLCRILIRKSSVRTLCGSREIRGPGVAEEQVATDFGVNSLKLWKWIRRSDVDKGTSPGTFYTAIAGHISGPRIYPDARLARRDRLDTGAGKSAETRL